MRNEFEKSGKYGMPLIKKQNIDLDKIELLSYLKTKTDDEENKNKTIHFSLMIGILKLYMKSRNNHLKNWINIMLCLHLNLVHIKICHLLDKSIAFSKIVGVVLFGKNKACL